jgi:hypothetical protein
MVPSIPFIAFQVFPHFIGMPSSTVKLASFLPFCFSAQYLLAFPSGARFLDRQLLLEVRDQVLMEGGVFIWSTFMEGAENLAPRAALEMQLLRYLFSIQGQAVFFPLILSSDAWGPSIPRFRPCGAPPPFPGGLQ